MFFFLSLCGKFSLSLSVTFSLSLSHRFSFFSISRSHLLSLKDVFFFNLSRTSPTSQLRTFYLPLSFNSLKNVSLCFLVDIFISDCVVVVFVSFSHFLSDVFLFSQVFTFSLSIGYFLSLSFFVLFINLNNVKDCF